jgi:hypothetical protein
MKVVRDWLRSRKQAYRRLFLGDEGKPSITGDIVLTDLARFCHAHESAFMKDERATLIMLGRQEVWLRIQHQLNMTDEQLWDFYARGVEADTQ